MRVCVVGAGLGGLTAARALAAKGADVVVRDAAVRAGGVIGTSRVDGFLREHAASSFLGGPGDGARALCDALGVAVEKASPAAKKRYIYLDGKKRQLPGNPLAFARSDLLTWRGKLDLLREPFRAAGGVADESMHAFAARRLGTEAARAIVAPFVTGVFAADAHDVSLEAGFPRLAALDHAGGIVRGMLKIHAKAVVDKVRGKLAPVAKTPRGMWAPVGGLQALIDALAKELGPRLELADAVAQVVAADRGVIVDGERFDGCVLALPAEQAAGLVEGELKTRLAGFTRSPVALVYLGYDDVPGVRDGFGMLTAQGEELRVLGVVFESVVWPDRAPAGKTLLRCIYGGGRDPSATQLTDTQLIAQARRDVEKALGATGAPIHASIVRWPRALAAYPVGHRERVAQVTAVARSRRIALAGADYRGAGVNDLCADAAVVADEVTSWR